ncbi:MAG: uroporphyrinogen decarboxylase [Actinomycetia bacterium]|nr:uroporphyrinogen decarboxylase [Actinomycetes bacterium]
MESELQWAELTPVQRLELRFRFFCDPGVPFAGREAETGYKARAARLKDAILLERTPDRVPVTTLNQFYPAYRAGFTPYDVMYDQEKAAEAWVSYAHRLGPDAMVGAAIAAAGAGPIFDALDYKLFSRPGRGVPPTAGFQYVEKEWMAAEEYDDLIEDPTGYMLRTYIPRTNGALAGMAKFEAPFGMVQLCGADFWVAGWGDPELQEAFSKLLEMGKQAAAWAQFSIGLDMRLMAEGFPTHPGLVTWAPFDFLGDTLRGTRGIVTDLYRYPDKVLAACERLLPVLLKYVTRKAAPFVPPAVFIPLHKGADGFMSDEQFRTFYWPTLRKMCLGLTEEGLVPYLFAEGSYDSRLEIIRDLPAGRTVWHFDQTDMRRAKQALEGIACIAGNVPLSLLQLGSPGEVTAYCRRLIDEVKGEGGFILDVGAGADTAKEENFAAMIDAAKEYGTY